MILATAVVGVGLALVTMQHAESTETKPVEVAEAPSTLELDGTVVPDDASAIALWLERYRDELLVLEVIPHGSFANEGDVLIRLDTTKIDRQIRQARFDFEQAMESHARTEEENRISEESAQADLARTRADAEWAAQKLAGHLDNEKGFTAEEIRLRNQATQHGLEDQRDELGELEKMYRADELVDATEEIVLKRSRRRLASSLAWASLREQQNDFRLALPERIKEETLRLDTEQKGAALARKDRSATIKRAARDASMERTRFTLEKQQRDLEQLERDRQLLTVRAPRHGLVLHGDAEATPGTGVLERGSRTSLFKTIMVVANPDRLKIVTNIPESSLFEVESGTAATVTLAAATGFGAIGRLDVSFLPTSRTSKGENQYRAELVLEERDPMLRPGMRCKVTVNVSDAQVELSERKD